VRRAVERRQPIREGAQLHELGRLRKVVEHTPHLVEAVAGRQLAVVGGEGVMEFPQRTSGEHRIRA